MEEEMDITLYVIPDELTGASRIVPDDIELKESEQGIEEDAVRGSEMIEAAAMAGDADRERRGAAIVELADQMRYNARKVREAAERYREVGWRPHERKTFRVVVPEYGQYLRAEAQCKSMNGIQVEVDRSKLMSLLLPAALERHHKNDRIPPNIAAELWRRIWRAMWPEERALRFRYLPVSRHGEREASEGFAPDSSDLEPLALAR